MDEARRPSGPSDSEPEMALRRAQQLAKLGYIIVGASGEFLAWSETLPEMIGRDPTAMPCSTETWMDLLHPADQERFRAWVVDGLRTGIPAELEYRLQRGSGGWMHVLEVFAPLVGEVGTRTVGGPWIRTLQDISAAKNAAGVLPTSEERYRATVEQAAVAIAHTSLEGELLEVNRALSLMTGYPCVELLQLSIRDLTHPDDIGPSLKGRADLVQRNAGPYQREMRLRRKDGAYFWAQTTTSLVFAANGAALHFVSVLHDISDRKRAEREINRLRAAMNSTLDSIFLSEPRTMQLLYVNDTACRRLGYTREQLLQKPAFELIGKSREQLQRADEEVIAAGERGTRTETRYVRRDGSQGWTELYRRAFAVETESLIVTVARNITERKAQQEKIEKLNRVYAVLSGINSTIVRVGDREELFRESCRIAHEAGGFDAVSIALLDEQKMLAEPVAWNGSEETAQWVSHATLSLRHERDRGPNLLAEMMQARTPFIANDAQNDPQIPFKEEMSRFGINSAIFLPLLVAENVIGVISIYSRLRGNFDEPEVKLLRELAADVSFALEHLEKSDRVAYLALYDEITGLANRRLLIDRLAQLLHTTSRARGKLALALLDIERLRSVNRSLGLGAGDALLRQVAERLTNSAGAAVVARSGSNHFALVLESVSDRADAECMLTHHLRACFDVPYVINGTEIKVGVKVGLVIFPYDGREAETLLVNAEAALRTAKSSGERHVFYTAALAERTGKWLSMESKLARALDRGEFVLHYQPKVDTLRRTIVGLEALIRWQSPDLGLVAPSRFIPLMEETGMIREVGAWALRRAALDHKRWSEEGFGTLRLAVNVSFIQLREREFVRSVKEALAEGVAPAGVDLEMTETLLMKDVEANIRKLAAVRALGVQLAIDDFGTGYSSLAYLAKLPVQAVKIDRSFIAAMMSDPPSMTLVQTIISLAHALRLTVVAEGVEQEAQAKYLGLLRCDQIQGYLISKPVPFEEMTRLLREERTDA